MDRKGIKEIFHLTDVNPILQTLQEDNATLESLVRADKAGLADYSRVIM